MEISEVSVGEDWLPTSEDGLGLRALSSPPQDTGGGFHIGLVANSSWHLLLFLLAETFLWEYSASLLGSAGQALFLQDLWSCSCPRGNPSLPLLTTLPSSVLMQSECRVAIYEGGKEPSQAPLLDTDQLDGAMGL